MERLLLDVYSSIGEPDGIYAVARSGDMASQLRLMQHEGGVVASCCRGSYPMHVCFSHSALVQIITVAAKRPRRNAQLACRRLEQGPG